MNEASDFRPQSMPVSTSMSKTADAQLMQRCLIIVALLVALRLVLAGVTPLAADEAYYWLWSKHLAGGYYDHPPAVALVIRLGTMLAGDTAFGVRVVSVLLAVPMTWAVFRAAETLFDRRVAARSAIFLNVTLMVAIGTVIVTPDTPLMVASAFVLFYLAKVLESGKGAWWLAVGAAVGVALLSKYTALFFGLSIFLWLALVPNLRRWLLTPWPYLGAVIAFAVFSPVIVWNAEHEWVSFIKQFGRARTEEFDWRYLVELLPVQFGLATPSIFILGTAGLVAMLHGQGGAQPARILLGVMVWPLLGYFVWHSLHTRVEGNWLAPVYPAFAIAAAVAAESISWRGIMRPLALISARSALPVGVALLVLIGLQATSGVFPLRNDPTGRQLAVGWRVLAADIEATRTKLGAQCIVATNYGLVSWLTFYLPPGTCVVQLNERMRWVNMPEPSAAQLAGKVLFIGDAVFGPSDLVRARYSRVTPQGTLARMRAGQPVETYRLDLAEGLTGDPIDRTPPPELQSRSQN